jgi:hypothetical protein
VNNTNRQYAEDLGVEVTTSLFDGGQTYTLRVVRGDQPGYNGPYSIRLTYYWGDNVGRFNRAVKAWLDDVPWPTEDDPRVTEEGVTL